MATAFEIQQAAAQKKAAETAQIQAATGTAAQFVGKIIGAPTTNIFSQIVDVFGGLAIGLSSFLTAKTDAKRKEQISQHQQIILQSVDKIINRLYQQGEDLIKQGMNPLSSEFETALYKALYEEIGYKGNCNLTAWMPGTQKTIWFEIKNNGTLLIPTSNLLDPPSDFQTYWSTKCRGVRDDWLKVYQNKLIQEGRQAELTDLQTSKVKQTLFFQIIFGLIFTILVVMFAFNWMRMK